MPNIWEFKNYDRDTALDIQNRLGISAVQARLLVLRGVHTAEEADFFLHAGLDRLTDPYEIAGIARAVARIQLAIDNHERIIIYGDYDVDGICSVVILLECLQALGGQVDYYVPDRFEEGYGLNQEAVVKLAQQGYQLLITVDCGISSVMETQIAMNLGMDVILTDHHTPPAVLPPALVVVNPKNGAIELSDLAGAGVAFKLAAALLTGKNMEYQICEWLPLVALATVADMVPLRYENRILVKSGMQLIDTCQRIGMRALLKECGMDGKPLQAWQLGFVLGPRLNAAGRMGSARTSIELLLCQELAAAQEKANYLGKMNDERRLVEEKIFQAAVAVIEQDSDLRDASILVVGGEGWHLGVIGIVASRLVARYNRPAVVISWDGEVGKGSARSPAGFNLYMGLKSVRDCLLGFGGHKMAAGLTLRKENLHLIVKGLQNFVANEGYQWTSHKHFDIDLELDEDDITPSLYEEIQMLEPFGEANPAPLFVLRAGAIKYATRVGLNKAHLKFALGHKSISGIAFNREDALDTHLGHLCQDVLFEIDSNNFRGQKNLQLKVKDIKPAFLPDDTTRINHCYDRLLQSIKKAGDELAARHPVVFVYPSHRSLVKHRSAMNHYFSSGKVIVLHGHLGAEERDISQKLLANGSSCVFMVTSAFLQYYQRRAQLPPNLRFMVLLWPEASQGDAVAGLENVETAMIRQHDRYRFYAAAESEISRGRVWLYANLPSTIKGLIKYHPRMRVESGLMDMKSRRNLRQEYWLDKDGVLICDGTHTVSWSGPQRSDQLILADSPLGSYELASLLEPSTDEEIRIGVAFKQDGLHTNRRFLNRKYPNLDLVNQVWTQLNGYILREDPHPGEDLADFISKEMNITRLEVASAVHVLADLNLCHFQKRSSIMAINRGTSGNYIDGLDNSPYWLEGLAEIRILSDWEQRISSDLEW